MSDDQLNDILEELQGIRKEVKNFRAEVYWTLGAALIMAIIFFAVRR